MPYVNQRWLGGMLTNFQTVLQAAAAAQGARGDASRPAGTAWPPRRSSSSSPARRTSSSAPSAASARWPRCPSAVWIVDTKKEHIAVGEARKLGIPVIAILDTNCDPDEVDYKIPGNDDAIRSAALLTRVIADAVAEGLMARAGRGRQRRPRRAAEPRPVGGDEPLPEWERELLAEPAATPRAAPSRRRAECRGQPRPRRRPGSRGAATPSADAAGRADASRRPARPRPAPADAEPARPTAATPRRPSERQPAPTTPTNGRDERRWRTSPPLT